MYDGFESLGLAAAASAIPFLFIYTKRVTAAYVSALTINSLFVVQATAPSLAGATVLLFLVWGVAYCFARWFATRFGIRHLEGPATCTGEGVQNESHSSTDRPPRDDLRSANSLTAMSLPFKIVVSIVLLVALAAVTSLLSDRYSHVGGPQTPPGASSIDFTEALRLQDGGQARVAPVATLPMRRGQQVAESENDPYVDSGGL